ncbi:MAG: IS66 family insertion sequence element accessory protein TnpB [Bdellovibrionales bacterium]|nr:IS66 family insertion sequence element accessory protein TnpB [Bdellovibrionales bacterium]
MDMRKCHDGLSGIVESEMNLELLSGSIFLFVNKTRRLCKAIYFDGSGLVIIHKRWHTPLTFGKACRSI